MNENKPELIFKGMRRFRYRNGELLLNDARRSPYYFWWAYLRLSKDYWWVCQRNGVADDQRLKAMYGDFGKVYEMTFDDWWERRGIGLFYEQMALPNVRQLDPQNLQLTKPLDGHLLLEIPIHMTERTIISKVREAIRNHPNRSVERISHAKRPLAKLVGIRQDVIEAAFQVWKAHYLSRDGRQVDKIGQITGTKSLYQIGKELRLVKSCMPMPTDDKERSAKRVNGMKVAVSRMLSRANYLIENAAVGIFPSVQPIKESIVWRTIQQQKLSEAVEAKQWRPLFDPNETLNV